MIKSGCPFSYYVIAVKYDYILIITLFIILYTFTCVFTLQYENDLIKGCYMGIFCH